MMVVTFDYRVSVIGPEPAFPEHKKSWVSQEAELSRVLKLLGEGGWEAISCMRNEEKAYVTVLKRRID